jgi:hypothetical protein
MASPSTFYELNDLPVFYDGTRLPVATTPTGEREVSFEDFLDHAIPIPEATYRAMIAKQGRRGDGTAPGRVPTHFAHTGDLKDPKARGELKASLVDAIVAEVEAERARQKAGH